jgi:hypothetical protein
MALHRRGLVLGCPFDNKTRGSIVRASALRLHWRFPAMLKSACLQIRDHRGARAE